MGIWCIYFPVSSLLIRYAHFATYNFGPVDVSLPQLGSAQFPAVPYRARLYWRVRMLDVLQCSATPPWGEKERGIKQRPPLLLFCASCVAFLALLVYGASASASICDISLLNTARYPDISSAPLWCPVEFHFTLFQALRLYSLLVPSLRGLYRLAHCEFGLGDPAFSFARLCVPAFVCPILRLLFLLLTSMCCCLLLIPRSYLRVPIARDCTSGRVCWMSCIA